jgi:tetratricopeptide (TPR) repeat protein
VLEFLWPAKVLLAALNIRITKSDRRHKTLRGHIMAQWQRIRIPVIFGILIFSAACYGGETQWIEVRSPNFVVLSDSSAKQARRTARSLEQFRGLLKTALPKLKVDSGTPLIAFALRDEKSLKALLPGEMLQRGAATPGGFFQGSSERNFVLLRMDAPEDQRYHTIYHEYVHLVMSLNYPELTLWLSEGLAEFFGFAEVGDGTSKLGIPSPALLQTLQTNTILPLATLMDVKHDSPYYRKQGMVEMFYAQSWALTHYFMIGDKRAHFAQLIEFLRLLQNDVPEKEAVQRAFGDLKTLEQRLQNYIRMLSFYHFQVPAKLSEKEDQYAVRELSPAESLAKRGEILVHINRTDDAKAVLEQALQLDTRSALAHEGMGILYSRLQNQEQAEKHFTAAAELDSRSFLANYYAAHAAYTHGDSALGENYLRKALAINPNFAPAYRSLSEHLARQREKLPEALELSRKAAALEPARLDNRANIARILIIMDRDDEARALADRILAIATTEADRGEASYLLSEIREKQIRRNEELKRAAALKEEQTKRAEQERRDQELEEQIKQQRESDRMEAKVEPIKTGAAGKVKGLIRSVKCDYPAVMDVILDSNGKIQKLHAKNYYQVQYWAVGEPGKSGFEPCEELEGKRVEIEFLAVSGQEFSGLIQTVAINK